MSLATADCIAAIETHSAGFADAARAADLAAPVEHCPGWTVADLVWHLTDVHWFWATIAGERLDAPPDESRRPARGADPALVDDFVAGARHLTETLRGADQSARCWTWAPWQQDVAFVTRHQVQEAAVHHWDAAHAAGLETTIGPAVAADAIEEFLSFSVPNPVDEDDPPGGTLDGVLFLRATDTDQSWTVSDHERAGTLAWATGGEGPAIEGTVSDLVLWLYQRIDLPAPDPGLVERFRRLCFTD